MLIVRVLERRFYRRKACFAPCWAACFSSAEQCLLSAQPRASQHTNSSSNTYTESIYGKRHSRTYADVIALCQTLSVNTRQYRQQWFSIRAGGSFDRSYVSRPASALTKTSIRTRKPSQAAGVQDLRRDLVKQQPRPHAAALAVGSLSRSDLTEEILSAKQVEQIQQLLMRFPDSWR